jgi:uncharacterized SAM-binding protein YcdF (DUF218 family)
MRRPALIAGALGLVVALAGATAWLFFAPPTDEPSRSDAVVVLGPGKGGERIEAGLRLLRDDIARVLVLSEGRSSGREEQRALCGRADQRFEVICFRADPFSTRGEARTVAALATARGWRSIVVVTSTYHVVRARMLFGRCYHGRLRVVDAHPSAGLLQTVRAIAHEWGGIVYGLTFGRGC